MHLCQASLREPTQAMRSARAVGITGEIVKVVEIEVAGSQENGFAPLHFRVEVMKVLGSGLITARVWRKEFYRIRPTFPQKRGRPSIPEADEVLLVEETSI